MKGYGLGEAGEGKNITHQQKKLNEEELVLSRKRFDLEFAEETIHEFAFIKPPDRQPGDATICMSGAKRWAAICRRASSEEDRTSRLRRWRPSTNRWRARAAAKPPRPSAFVGVLKALLKHPELGKYVVPIIPDEARTFGMESMFRERGIYASQGQLYKPVDSDVLMYYKEAQNGQILEEGITEAGSMASFTAAGTAYANYGVPMIPFFIYYSMFGFQRVGDLIWAFADSRGKGFLVGGTAGRTTLLGEGLQHQDGHSHVLSSTVPTCKSYDPAFAYEIAVIVQDGIRRMYEDRRRPLLLPDRLQRKLRAAADARRRGIHEGILRGHLQVPSRRRTAQRRSQLFGSGSILNEALQAQQILAEKYEVGADVWSVTSYNELRRDALTVERWNRLHPTEPRTQAVPARGAGRMRQADRRGFRLHEDRAPTRLLPGCRAV